MISNPPLRSWHRSISFLPTGRHTRLFRREGTQGEKKSFASFWIGKPSRRRKDSVAKSLGRIMTSFFLGKKTSASFQNTFCGSSRSGRINTFYAGRSGQMRALSVSAELKEYPLKAPPFGSRAFI